MNVVIFFLALFLDFFEIAFIVLPLIAPVAEKMGIDMTWLAVLIAANLQTSFMHPPFGIALYNPRSVAPAAVETTQIYWGAVPFILVQLFMVFVLIAFPHIVSTAPEMVEDIENVHIPIPVDGGPPGLPLQMPPR